jgi:hypothetical protein
MFPEKDILVLTLNTSECDLIYKKKKKKHLYRGEWVKLRPLGWVSSNMSGVLVKMGNLNTETDRHRGKKI